MATIKASTTVDEHEESIKEPWSVAVRSSKSFIISVVSVAIFAVCLEASHYTLYRDIQIFELLLAGTCSRQWTTRADKCTGCFHIWNGRL